MILSFDLFSVSQAEPVLRHLICLALNKRTTKKLAQTLLVIWLFSVQESWILPWCVDLKIETALKVQVNYDT